MRTSLDELKETVDFRIIGVASGKFEITWNNGGNEIVTRRKLNSLKSNFSWTVDF